MIFSLVSNYKINRRKFRNTSYSEERSSIEAADISSIQQRVFEKYRGQRFVEGAFIHNLLNLACLVLSLPVILYLKLYGSLYRRLQSISPVHIYSLSVSTIELSSLSIEAEQVNLSSPTYAGASISHFLRNLFRKEGRLPFYPALVDTIVSSRWQNMVMLHTPEIVYSSNEYSFVSPRTYEICSDNNVSLVNVMHGEKLFDIVDAYSIYHKVVCWHERYVKLFISLRWTFEEALICSPYPLERPQEIENLPGNEDHNKNFSVCYYLQGNLQEVEGSLATLKKYFHSIYVRPHPKYTDKPILDYEPDPFADINESIKSYDYVCSAYSTILLQALPARTGILLDDLTDTFARESGRWWMLDEKPPGVFLLSELKELPSG